jgi:hypothetical protein
MKRNQINIILGVSLILIAAIARIANREMHLYNLAPVAAVGLFSGAILKDKRFAYIMPLLAMFVADLYFELFTRVNGFYGLEQIINYGALMAVTALGTKMGQPKALKILGLSLAGSVVFFLISNFGSFLTGMYGKGFNALVTTYTMAIPFFKNTVVSDLLGNAVLFGLYFIAMRSFSVKTEKA